MKIRIQNLGPIGETNAEGQPNEVEFGQGLTVFVGPNHSGKTYVNYAIHGMLNSSLNLEAGLESLSRHYAERMIKEPRFEVDVGELIEQVFTPDLAEHIPGALRRRFKGFYGSQPREGFQIELDFTEADQARVQSDGFIDYSTSGSGLKSRIIRRPTETHFSFSTSLEPLNIQGTSADGEVEIREEDMEKRVAGLANHMLSSFLSGVFFPRLYTALAERSGLAQFAPEINSLRMKLWQLQREAQIQGYDLSESRTFRETQIPDYPYAVEDAIRFQQRNLNQGKRKFEPIIAFIEQQVLGGQVAREQTGGYVYRTTPRQGVQPLELPLYATSSAVKTLADVLNLVGHYARPGDLVIIDEPEQNLHPDNQRRLARGLAMLMHHGLNLIVSTHSMTILQEFNNLIMLGSESARSRREHRARLMERFGYEEEMCIAPERVRPYLFHGGGISRLRIDDAGMDLQPIIRHLEQLNRATDAIYFDLILDDAFEDEEEADEISTDTSAG